MQVIDFKIPFSGFNSMTFSNVFASAHMYLCGLTGSDDYDCASRDGGNCNGCGNCNGSSAKLQEDYYFLFDTMCGRSSERVSFEGKSLELDNTPETVDFIMKFAGYEYKILTRDYIKAVCESVAAGKPCIARMKDTSHGVFRIIIGTEDDNLIAPPPKNAQRAEDKPVTADEIAELLVITAKITPKYTLLDGLEKIRSAMEHNRDTDMWGGCIYNLKYWDRKLADADFDELKRRFKRLCDSAWFHFNCHNFAETFRHRITDELRDKRLDECFRKIETAYDGSHTRNWQLIALHDCRDWSSRRYNELEWGMCECAIQCLEKLREYDEIVLAAINEAISILTNA